MASAPAWADDIAIAPQLTVDQTGPVTVTFLGMNSDGIHIPGFTYVSSATLQNPSGSNISVLSFGSPGFPVPGTTASITGLSAGRDITFNTQFNTSTTGGFNLVNSATGATPAVAAFLGGPAIFGTQTLRYNAGVIASGPNSVLIGFTPSGSTPSSFNAYQFRVSVSNVSFGGLGGGCRM